MEDIIIGWAVLECMNCGCVKQVTIRSSMDKYQHDYSSIMNMGHVCSTIYTNVTTIGKMKVKAIHFNLDVVDVNAETDDIISITHPPLKINWGSNKSTQERKQ